MMWVVILRSGERWGEECADRIEAHELLREAKRAGRRDARVVELNPPPELLVPESLPPRDTLESQRLDDLRHGVATGED